MSRTHTGPTIDGLLKGGLPNLPNQGPEHTFNPADHLTAYLTVEDVAALLHVTPRTVQGLFRDSAIRSSFIGRRYLTTRANVEAYIKSRAEGGPDGE
jgi:excisionase family DNA binding protein